MNGVDKYDQVCYNVSTYYMGGANGMNVGHEVRTLDGHRTNETE